MSDIVDLLNYLKTQDNDPEYQRKIGLQSLATVAPYLPYTLNMNQYMQPASQLAGGMTDLNNPKYQQLYGQFKQQGQQNLAAQIAELQRQNRLSTRMGRTPLFDSARGGEQLFRQLNKGYQDVGNNASQQALGQLNAGYQAQAQLGAQKKQNAFQQAGAIGNIGGALVKLFDL